MQRNKSEQMMRLNENSALKGKLGEQIMENQLNLLFPSSEVLDVRTNQLNISSAKSGWKY